jgi:predicted  nucleic acid-binding Zn-ribbon protein
MSRHLVTLQKEHRLALDRAAANEAANIIINNNKGHSLELKEELDNAMVRIQELEDELTCLQDRTSQEANSNLEEKSAAETRIGQLQQTCQQAATNARIFEVELQAANAARQVAEQRFDVFMVNSLLLEIILYRF